MSNEETLPHMNDDSFLDWEHRPESFPFHKHMIAGISTIQTHLHLGSLAGIMEHVGMFPLDTVKVCMIPQFHLCTVDSFAS